jgi:hypothetical protein
MTKRVSESLEKKFAFKTKTRAIPLVLLLVVSDPEDAKRFGGKEKSRKQTPCKRRLRLT